jgi:hypothetical protein
LVVAPPIGRVRFVTSQQRVKFEKKNPRTTRSAGFFLSSKNHQTRSADQQKKDLQNEVCRNTQGSFLRPAASSLLAPLMFLSAWHLHDKQHTTKKEIQNDTGS